MTTLEKSEKAQRYYNSFKDKGLASGFERFICTDGQKCMFVNRDYEPTGEEVVFLCDTRRFCTRVNLHKLRSNAKK